MKKIRFNDLIIMLDGKVIPSNIETLGHQELADAINELPPLERVNAYALLGECSMFWLRTFNPKV